MNNQSNNGFNPYTSKNDVVKEHEQMLIDLNFILQRLDGQRLFKYLFKHFGVLDLPPLNIDPDFRLDMMGYLRAGRALFEIASQANAQTAGLILAEIQKEKHNVQDS